MSKALVLDSKFKQSGEIDLPKAYTEIDPHNLYLYVKSYQAALRANTAVTKTRADVRGGGRKPWAQKGGGRARAGSTRSPIWVGGGVAHGPKNNRNYNQKVNKKQKRLALNFALNEKAEAGRLLIVDSAEISSGKTKDALAFITATGARDALVVKELLDEKSFFAFRNIKNAYLVEPNEVNAYTVAAFETVVIEKSVFETLVKED